MLRVVSFSRQRGRRSDFSFSEQKDRPKNMPLKALHITSNLFCVFEVRFGAPTYAMFSCIIYTYVFSLFLELSLFLIYTSRRSRETEKPLNSVYSAYHDKKIRGEIAHLPEGKLVNHSGFSFSQKMIQQSQFYFGRPLAR